MPTDSRRINGPETVLAPAFLNKDATLSPLVNKNGLRKDKRHCDQFRPSWLKVDVGSEATGSAYYESGNTKILCSVYGPRDVIRKSEFSLQGQLFCEFKYAPYSCEVRQSHVPSSEEKCISASLQQALEAVVLLHKFPKAKLDVFILVLENDGGAVSGALTCAGAALANAGVEMYDLVIGCSLVQYGKYTLVDPTAEEEKALTAKAPGTNVGRVVLGMMPSYNQVVMLTQDGDTEISALLKCIKELMKECLHLHPMIIHYLKQSVEEKEKAEGIQLVNGESYS